MTAHKSLWEAWLAFQANPPEVKLDASNPHFRNRFASLPGNLGAIRKRASEEGLVILQPLSATEDGAPAITTVIVHAATGEKFESSTPLLLGGKTDPQSHGSAVTYARRYGLYSMLSLVGDEDDDGNVGSQVRPAKGGLSATKVPQPASGDGDPPSSPDAGADEFPEFAPDMPKVEQESFPVPNDGITDKQLKYLKMLAEKLIKAEGAWTVEMFRKHLGDTYGVTSTKALTKAQATEAIDHFKHEAVDAGLIEG